MGYQPVNKQGKKGVTQEARNNSVTKGPDLTDIPHIDLIHDKDIFIVLQ